eukprot:g3344.t1
MPLFKSSVTSSFLWTKQFRPYSPLGGYIRSSSSKVTSNSVGILGMYSSLLVSHPLLTKSITSGVLVAAGDAVCQLAIEQQSLDMKRLLRMAFLGTALIGPTLHIWYGRLHKLVPAQTTVGALQRLALDQLVFGPTFIVIFFTALFGLEGRIADIPQHLRENYIESVLTNWTMWVPGNFINFRFVPPHYQVLFSNFIALFWNTYLSWNGHRGEHEEKLN